MGWVKDSLLGKAKALHARKKKKKGIHSQKVLDSVQVLLSNIFKVPSNPNYSMILRICDFVISWFCDSMILWTKLLCFINAVVITSSQDSTIWAVMKKNNSIPDKSRTDFCQNSMNSDCNLHFSFTSVKLSEI